MELFLFFAFSIISIASGIMVITQKNAVYSGLYLLLAFFCLAGLYILLRAEFVAVMQIAVYAGAIMVLFLFVIMLLNLRVDTHTFAKPIPRILGLVVAVLFVIELAWVGFRNQVGDIFFPDNILHGTTQAIGKELYKHYIIPFEAVGVLLLVAMIGAIYLAKRKHD